MCRFPSHDLGEMILMTHVSEKDKAISTDHCICILTFREAPRLLELFVYMLREPEIWSES